MKPAAKRNIDKINIGRMYRFFESMRKMPTDKLKDKSKEEETTKINKRRKEDTPIWAVVTPVIFE